MCGRFSLTKTEKELEQYFKSTFYTKDIQRWNPNYNAAPGTLLPVVAQSDVLHFQYKKWGLVPSWSNDANIGYKMINARIETAHEKPAFKNLLQRKRCLVPADGYYEWSGAGKVKHPFRIHLSSNEPFFMAGLVDENLQVEAGSTLESFTIFTRSANEKIQPIHHRMPLILSVEKGLEWLKSNASLQELENEWAITQNDAFTYYKVNPALNAATKNSKDLIEPYDFPTDLFG